MASAFATSSACSPVLKSSTQASLFPPSAGFNKAPLGPIYSELPFGHARGEMSGALPAAVHWALTRNKTREHTTGRWKKWPVAPRTCPSFKGNMQGPHLRTLGSVSKLGTRLNGFHIDIPMEWTALDQHRFPSLGTALDLSQRRMGSFRFPRHRGLPASHVILGPTHLGNPLTILPLQTWTMHYIACLQVRSEFKRQVGRFDRIPKVLHPVSRIDR